jgi:hypothetical protein
MKRYLTAGRLACLGVILALVGNELTGGEVREGFEIAALVIAAIGLIFENGHTA